MWLLIVAAAAIILLFFAVVFLSRDSEFPRIFVFHSLRPGPLEFNGMTLGAFSRHIESIHKLGFSFGTIDEAISLPSIVSITFDDGYCDILDATELLLAKGISFTIFFPTEFVGKQNSWDNFLAAGKKRHLNVEEIRNLASRGVTFGSHGHSHVDLTALSYEELAFELTESRKILKEHTATEIDYLAPPFGKINGRVLAAAKAAGFSRVLLSAPVRSTRILRPVIATSEATKQSHESNPLEEMIVGRSPISRFDTSLTLKAKLVLSWMTGFEIIKSRITARFSHLTPLLQRLHRKTPCANPQNP